MVFVFIEILFKMLLFKGGVLIYAEHYIYIYIYIYIYMHIYAYTVYAEYTYTQYIYIYSIYMVGYVCIYLSL